MTAQRQVRQRQDRSRKSGHAHSLSIQDHPPLALTPTERAAWKFCNVAALLPTGGPQYDLLPPSARMAVDAVKKVAAQLEPSIQSILDERTHA